MTGSSLPSRADLVRSEAKRSSGFIRPAAPGLALLALLAAFLLLLLVLLLLEGLRPRTPSPWDMTSRSWSRLTPDLRR